MMGSMNGSGERDLRFRVENLEDRIRVLTKAFHKANEELQTLLSSISESETDSDGDTAAGSDS